MGETEMALDKSNSTRLLKDLKRVSGSLKLDGKEWMATVVDNAIVRLHNRDQTIQALLNREEPK